MDSIALASFGCDKSQPRNGCAITRSELISKPWFLFPGDLVYYYGENPIENTI